MIKDTLDHAFLYSGVHPRLALAFDYLRSFQPATSDGRYELDGDNVFALVQSYRTQPSAEKSFESHRTYIDLQYIAAGEETMLSAPVTRLVSSTAYDADKDFSLYAEPVYRSTHEFHPGDFAIFFPHDGHKPGCTLNGSVSVKKVVIKIRL